MEQASEKENGTVIIYGQSYCSQAKLLRDTLDQQQINYEWRDIREATLSIRKSSGNWPMAIFRCRLWSFPTGWS
jgi:hypothetical protein